MLVGKRPAWVPLTLAFVALNLVGVPVVLILTKVFVESTRAPIEGHLRGLHARILGDFYQMATTHTTIGGDHEALS